MSGFDNGGTEEGGCAAEANVASVGPRVSVFESDALFWLVSLC